MLHALCTEYLISGMITQIFVSYPFYELCHKTDLKGILLHPNQLWQMACSSHGNFNKKIYFYNCNNYSRTFWKYIYWNIWADRKAKDEAQMIATRCEQTALGSCFDCKPLLEASFVGILVCDFCSSFLFVALWLPDYLIWLFVTLGMYWTMLLLFRLYWHFSGNHFLLEFELHSCWMLTA